MHCAWKEHVVCQNSLPKKNRWNRITIQGRKKHENHRKPPWAMNFWCQVSRGSERAGCIRYVRVLKDSKIFISFSVLERYLAYFLQALPKFIEEMITICLIFWGQKEFPSNFCWILPFQTETIPQKKSLGNLGRGQKKGKKMGSLGTQKKHITTKNYPKNFVNNVT